LVSFGGGATGWMLVSNPVLAGSTDWQVSATTKWVNAYDPPMPAYYGIGGLLLSDNIPSDTLTGNWLWIGYTRGNYGDGGNSWSLPVIEGNLGGSAVSIPVVGPAFRDFTAHSPIPMTISRTNGTAAISLSITSPLDGPVDRFYTFTGAQATALDSLQYVGFANYYSDWQYDNLSASVRAYGWTGGPGDWSATNNWTGGLAASNGTVVNFSGAGGASTNNSLGSVTGITFSNGAGSYTVSGNAVTLGAAGIANNSGNLQTVSNNLTLGASAAVSSASGAVVVAGNTALSSNTMTFAATAAITNSGVISGSGAVVKTGAGTATLSGNNSFTGAVTVNAGVLELSAAGGAIAATTNVSVANGATLLVAQSNQVNNDAVVTLSGGTVKTAAGVSEVFGNLIVSSASFLDFGATSYETAGSMSFGTYTPSALLTLNNFNFGSTLTFKSNLSGSITNSSFFTFNNGGIASSNWDGTTFTITAIPEASTYAAAAGLLALFLVSAAGRLPDRLQKHRN
jgi:autotransporter-associated beta strand protein